MRLLHRVPFAGLIMAAAVLAQAAEAGASDERRKPEITLVREEIAPLPKERGDVRAGQRFAEQICAQCHAVGARETRSPNPRAPSFPDIAASPGLTAIAIRVWLQTPHPTMPNIRLSDTDKDNIVAYLLSLKAA